MRTVEFQVQGSATEPYRLVFKGCDGSLYASCTCKAGAIGTHCKHKANILLGILDGIVVGSVADVHMVASWAHGSSVEAAVRELELAEQRLSDAKKEVTKAKQLLAAAWRGL